MPEIADRDPVSAETVSDWWQEPRVVGGSTTRRILYALCAVALLMIIVFMRRALMGGARDGFRRFTLGSYPMGGGPVHYSCKICRSGIYNCLHMPRALTMT